MKILVHDYIKDTNPEKIISYCNLSSVMIITEEDIVNDQVNIEKLRGFMIYTILIPKDFEIDKRELLNKTKFWNYIQPMIDSNKEGKIIYY